MLEDDYILRAVRQIGEAIARAMGLAKQGKTDESVDTLEGAIEALTSLPSALVETLDAASLRQMLGHERAQRLVELLQALATVHAGAGDEASAAKVRLRASAIATLLADDAR